MKELILKDDMGSDFFLRLIQEDDGDIIISVCNQYNKFTADTVQFCTSGTVNNGVAAFFGKLINQHKEQTND